MTDTEILNGMEGYGISVWPDRESRTNPSSRVAEWNTFARNPNNRNNPVQVTRASLRAALVDTIEKIESKGGDTR